jgi:ribosomal protein L14E/L6E/L27E
VGKNISNKNGYLIFVNGKIDVHNVGKNFIIVKIVEKKFIVILKNAKVALKKLLANNV